MWMKTGTALFVMGALQAPMKTGAVELEAALTRAVTNLNYQAPSSADLAHARHLFADTLTGSKSLETLQPEWSRLGFELREVTGAGEALWLLSEPAGTEAGRGWYLFRHTESTVAIEAPHAKNDVHTGLISLRIFLVSQARVLACSTITRRRADMAHLDDTYFQAFTLAFAQIAPTGLVVQLHGFESNNHHGTKASIVASAGSRTPEPWFGDFIRCLRQDTALSVLAYPDDIKQLGGTTNAQGQALARTGRCRFLHLEFSLESRERLTRDQALRKVLLNCIAPTKPG
jgi:hypothetical protein